MKVTVTCAHCKLFLIKNHWQIRTDKSFCNKSCARSYKNLQDNPSKHRDISGKNNPMWGKSYPAWNRGLKGERSHNWKGGKHTRQDGYVRVNENGTRILEHRKLLRDAGVQLDGLVVHHKNANPSDNRLSNLQVMTQSEHARLHKQIQYAAS